MTQGERAAAMRREQSRHGEYNAVRITNTDHDDILYSVPPKSGESGRDIVRRTLDLIAEAGAKPVSLEVFGGLTLDGDYDAAVIEANAPITWVGEEHFTDDPVRGVQAWAVTGCTVEPIRVGETLIGTMFEDAAAQYCRLGGLMPSSTTADVETQTREVFDQMEAGLAAARLTFDDVLRTWFYNRNMLTWYDRFNTVRHEYFNRWNVFDGMVPASTGVGGLNARDGALQAGLLAVRPKEREVIARAVPSPLQCPALEYGSAFSRAAELVLPDQRRLYVSGTASIAPGGETIFVGDMDGQIRLTMQVVQAILHSREMNWADVTRAIVYIKQPEHMRNYETYCCKHELPAFPTVMICNDICRDDLLFEIELDALRSE